MFKRILPAIFMMCLQFNAFAQNNSIENEVIGEMGFYDAAEIEKRKRINSLTSFPNMMLGDVIMEGSCSSYPCENPMLLGASSKNNNPIIAAIKGTAFSRGIFKNNISLKINNDQINAHESTSSDTSGSKFLNYQIFVTYESEALESNEGASAKQKNVKQGAYKVYSLTVDRMSNGTLPKREFIKVKTTVSGSYLFSIRAVFGGGLTASHSAWSEAKGTQIQISTEKVSDVNSPSLNSCLTNNGYGSEKYISQIYYLDCSDQALLDSDMDIIVNKFTGIRYLNLSKNPAINTTRNLGNLAFLSWLDLSENPQLNFNSLWKYGQIDSIVLKNNGLTIVPEMPKKSSYINLSNNPVSSGFNNIFNENRRDKDVVVFKFKQSGLTLSTAALESVMDELSLQNVNTLDLSGNKIPLNTDFSTIPGIKYLQINSSEIDGNFDLSTLPGLCGLSINNSNLTGVTGQRPVQFLSLKNNPNLIKAHPLKNNEFWSFRTDFTNSNKLKCSNFYSFKEKFADSSIPKLGNMAVVSEVAMPDGSLQSPPVCPVFSESAVFNEADFCRPDMLKYVDAYFNEETGFGLLNWRFADWIENESWGLSHFRIREYDQSGLLLDEYNIPSDQYSLQFNSSEVKGFGVSACTQLSCGGERLSGDFQQGLARPESIEVVWNVAENQNITPEDLSFKVSFSYSNDAFISEYGRPEYFLLKPTFEGNDSENEVIKPVNGFQDVWEIEDLVRDDFIGVSFSLEACRQDIGCGLANQFVIDVPLTSTEIPKPSINLVTAENDLLSVEWGFNDTLENVEKIDYIQIIEKQPYYRMNAWPYYAASSGSYSTNRTEVISYTEKVINNQNDLSGGITLNRLVEGEYTYNIKACIRDRENGDRCSETSDRVSKRMSVNLDRGFLNTISSQGWYKEGNKNHITWTDAYQRADYYILRPENLSVKCLQADGSVNVNLLNNIIVHKADMKNNTFSTKTACDTISSVDSNGIKSAPVGNMHISPCKYGKGCDGIIGYPYNREYIYKVDFDGAQTNPPIDFLTTENTTGSISGGPGDMRPGNWWNPEQGGTGWHFYWASELRYPSIHENYGKTYDLLAYWLAYKEVNGVWTPTWFFSHLKQADEGSFFQGEVLYVTYDKNSNTTSPENVGQLQVHFNNNESDNEKVTVSFDMDYSNGVFTGEGQCDNGGALGQCAYELQHYSIGNVPGNVGNDADHYSGAWWHYNDDGTLDESMTWLTWIDDKVEVTSLATYDTQGEPVWLQAHTCYPNENSSCNSFLYPGESYFDDYTSQQGKTFHTVNSGFNPLATKPSGYVLSDNFTLLGNGGRTFDTIDDYTKGEFWVNTYGNKNIGANRTLNLSYGTSRNNMKVMTKIASFHDIRFFINDKNESTTFCDPNDPEYGTCDVKFTWFTDDDFINIKPYYRKKSGGAWGAFAPLSELDNCSGVPLGQYVVKEFVCNNFNEGGDYEFELRKPSHINNNVFIPIAKSKTLTIEACIQSECMNVSEPKPPEEAPLPLVMMDDIVADPINDSVGVTAGGFDVDQSGSATYSLPIYAPKGRGGLAPQLGLSYNSGAGNGVAGMGWNISGLSAISRCLKSKETDPQLTYFPAVSYTWDDAFCLDGMRMFKVSENETEVEYKTEIEGFSKVIAIKDSNYPTGPKLFVVYTKSGEKWSYGSPGPSFKAGKIFTDPNGGSGAQVLRNDEPNVVSTWLLSQITDRPKDTTGMNRIRFSYDTKGGESYLGVVKWSSFGNGDKPHYQIDFDYSDNMRPDALLHYTTGGVVKSYKNLESIKTKILASPTSSSYEVVRDLKLSYEAPYGIDNPSGVLRVTQIQQCLQNNQCLQPVKFTWDNGNSETGLSTLSADASSTTGIEYLKEMGYGSYKPIDINGDGKMEIIFVRGYDNGNWFTQNDEARFWVMGDMGAFLPEPTSSNPDPQLPVGQCKGLLDMGSPDFQVMCNTHIEPFHADDVKKDAFNAEKWFVFDFNGDGYQDILTPKRDDNVGGDAYFDHYFVFYSNGYKICTPNNTDDCDGLMPVDTSIKSYNLAAGSSFLDYTADGLPDLVTFEEVTEGGDTTYKYSIYPLTKHDNTFLPSVVSSEPVNIDETDLIPNLRCFFKQGSNQVSLPCDFNPNGVEEGKIYNGKIEQMVSDFNGDGYNDAIYTYKYVYSNYQSCDEYADLGIINQIDSGSQQTAPEYTSTAEFLFEEELGDETIQGNPVNNQRCELTFKSLMYFSEENGQPSFKLGEILGIVDNYTDVYAMNDSMLSFDCSAGSCDLPYVNASGRGMSPMDINGDGLTDLVTFSKTGSIGFRLNKGVVNDAEDSVFEPYQYAISSISSPIKICNIRNRQKPQTNHSDPGDSNICARQYLTQFVDYDLDGDLDILLPEDITNNGDASDYLLYRYQLTNTGEPEYVYAGNTGIFSYDTLYKRDPLNFNTSFWDVNGDGHFDYFNLQRAYRGSDNDNDHNLVLILGANPWMPRNRVSSIDHLSGSLVADSVIDLKYESMTKRGYRSAYTHSVGSLLNSEDYGNGSPVFDILAPMYLLSEVSKSAPTQANPAEKTVMKYFYSGMKVQGSGRGSLGFESVSTLDTSHDVLTTTYYKQSFPFIGMPSATTTEYTVSSGTSYVLAESQSIYGVNEVALDNGQRSYFTYLKQSYEKNNNLDVLSDNNFNSDVTITGVSNNKVTLTDFTYDSDDVIHGNLSFSETRVCSGDTNKPTLGQSGGDVCRKTGAKELIKWTKTENSYQDDVENWFLGRLSHTKVTSERKQKNGSYASKAARESSFNYDVDSGQLTEEIIHGSDYQFLRTKHQYDIFGQKTATFQCSVHVPEADCATPPENGRNMNRGYVHRYTKVQYDSLWNEYVESEIKPFTDHEGLSLAKIENIESASVPTQYLDKGAINELALQTLFPDSNAEGRYRDIFGNPLLVANIDGVKTRMVYGSSGELHASASELGGKSSVKKRWCDASGQVTYRCPSHAATVIIKESSTKPLSRSYYDALGREIRSQVINFNGKWQTTDTSYDSLGRTTNQTEPYLINENGTVGSQIYTTTTKYDVLDRVVKIKTPGHCIEQVASVTDMDAAMPCENVEVVTFSNYLGMSVSTTNALSQTSTKILDETGKVIESYDADGELVSYGYDAHDNLTSTTSYLEDEPITITMSYDHMGRKHWMDDPDKGKWYYYYNALGELHLQKSANHSNGYSVKNWYDIQGRLFFRMDTDGSRSVWDYDVYYPGKLRATYALGRHSSEGISKFSIINYDQLGRLENKYTTINDPSLEWDGITYKTSTKYDEFSRVFQKFDTSNDDDEAYSNNHGIQYIYNENGYQSAIQDAENGMFGQEYYRTLNVDARGQVTHEQHHGSISSYKEYIPQTGFLSSIETVNEQGEVVQDMSFAFDQIGNLIRRTDYVMNNGGPQRQVNEWFWYDNLNRLTETHSDGHNNSGNIESVASYGYDETGNLKFKHGTTLKYDHPTKPHAVTFAQGGGPTKNYFYDDNGNVTHIENSSNQVVSNFEYSSFDKAELMQANDWSARVYYDAGRSRYIRKDYQGMGPIDQSDSDMKTTHYVDGVEYIYQGGSYQVKRHLGNVIIESTELSKYRNQWKYSYLLKDHLGSTHTVVNRQGQHNGRFSFTEWGERRRALMPTEDDFYQEYTIAGVWSALGEQIEDTTNRGFTGHEHFDQVGIIHMNGRIYDATIGRFLQADPIIQDPYNTQSLNRYSYVMNNPLSYTDPSGYSRLRKGWWRMPVAIVVSVYTAGAASGLMAGAQAASLAGSASGIAGFAGGAMASYASSALVTQAIIVSVAGGAVAGAISTGNLKGAVKGGVMAAVTFGIGHGFDGTGGVGAVGSADRIIAHSLVSGVSAEIDGGQFGHGFASAALSQAIGKGAIFNHEEVGLTAIVTNALLQGSISELTGGKFANGAMSATFRVAFNHVLTRDNKNQAISEAIKEGKRLRQKINNVHKTNYYFEEISQYKGHNIGVFVIKTNNGYQFSSELLIYDYPGDLEPWNSYIGDGMLFDRGHASNKVDNIVAVIVNVGELSDKNFDRGDYMFWSWKAGGGNDNGGPPVYVTVGKDSHVVQSTGRYFEGFCRSSLLNTGGVGCD